METRIPKVVPPPPNPITLPFISVDEWNTIAAARFIAREKWVYGVPLSTIERDYLLLLAALGEAALARVMNDHTTVQNINEIKIMSRMITYVAPKTV